MGIDGEITPQADAAVVPRGCSLAGPRHQDSPPAHTCSGARRPSGLLIRGKRPRLGANGCRFPRGCWRCSRTACAFEAIANSSIQARGPGAGNLLGAGGDEGECGFRGCSACCGTNFSTTTSPSFATRYSPLNNSYLPGAIGTSILPPTVPSGSSPGVKHPYTTLRNVPGYMSAAELDIRLGAIEQAVRIFGVPAQQHEKQGFSGCQATRGGSGNRSHRRQRGCHTHHAGQSFRPNPAELRSGRHRAVFRRGPDPEPKNEYQATGKNHFDSTAAATLTAHIFESCI